MEPAADDSTIVQGKTIEQWLAALKDRDAAVRKRAVEILGERALDPDVPASERSKLEIAVTSLLHSDKDRDVGQAAAFFTDLFRFSRDRATPGETAARHRPDAQSRPPDRWPGPAGERTSVTSACWGRDCRRT
jgi:hypothetical protein